MSKLIICITLAFTTLCGAIAASKAMSPHQSALPFADSCELADIGRAGGLTYVSRQDAWISRRGQVFRISGCPMPRNALRGL